MSEGVAKKETPPIGAAPPGGGYYFDPLPQRKKRARVATTSSCTEGETLAKRRGLERGEAGATGDKSEEVSARSDNHSSGDTPSSDGAATPNQRESGNGKEGHQTNKVL